MDVTATRRSSPSIRILATSLSGIISTFWLGLALMHPPITALLLVICRRLGIPDVLDLPWHACYRHIGECRMCIAGQPDSVYVSIFCLLLRIEVHDSGYVTIDDLESAGVTILCKIESTRGEPGHFGYSYYRSWKSIAAQDG